MFSGQSTQADGISSWIGVPQRLRSTAVIFSNEVCEKRPVFGMTARYLRQMSVFAARLVVMADGWTPAQLLDAVQARVVHGPDGDGETPMQATLDGSDLLVTFRWPGEPQLLCMRFPVPEAPVGPSTGELCDTPAEWANEVGWVLMEELDTGLARWGRRSVTSHGWVELHYRPAPD